MGATRRLRKRLLVQLEINDDASPEEKNAAALRAAANVAGRCPSCGATFRVVWHAPGLGQQVMEHEPWCEAEVDPPGFREVVAAELRKLASEREENL